MKSLVIIGGGASGFFLASNFKSDRWKVTILERSDFPMKKLEMTGGERCNLTNACFSTRELIKNYPRGGKKLKKPFSIFQPKDTMEWFEERGIALKTEKDNRVFPKSNDSKSISSTLMQGAVNNGTEIIYSCSVKKITKSGQLFNIETNRRSYEADAVVVSTGGITNIMANILSDIGHTIICPIPSLFTFKCKSPLINNLPGISFEKAELSIPSLKLKESAPLLITHQGISGPVVLRLSAWGARELYAMNYKFNIKVNWISTSFELTREIISNEKSNHPKKMLYSFKPFDLKQRFWDNVIETLAIDNKPIGELSKSDINKLAETLTNTTLEIESKNNFKDEFVTAGGVDTEEVDFNTMQSKIIENLYFSGEVLNIDGITGGFNLQACWSEAFTISKHLKSER